MKKRANRRSSNKRSRGSNGRAYAAQCFAGQCVVVEPKSDDYIVIVGPSDVYLKEAFDFINAASFDLIKLLRSWTPEGAQVIVLSPGKLPAPSGNDLRMQPWMGADPEDGDIGIQLSVVRDAVAPRLSTIDWVPFTHSLFVYYRRLMAATDKCGRIPDGLRNVWPLELMLQWAKYINRFNSSGCCFGRHGGRRYPDSPEAAAMYIGSDVQLAVDTLLGNLAYAAPDNVRCRFAASSLLAPFAKICAHFAFAVDPVHGHMHCVPKYPQKRGRGSVYLPIWVTPSFCDNFPYDIGTTAAVFNSPLLLYVGDYVAPWFHDLSLTGAVGSRASIVESCDGVGLCD